MSLKLFRTAFFAISMVVSLGDLCDAQAVPELPAPTGQYAVGRQEFAWTDETRHEPTSQDLAARRELVVDVWYPAAASSGMPAPYLEPAQLQIVAFANVYGLAWQAVHDGAIKTHSWKNAKLAATHEPFPVLVFSPGLGLPTTAYTFLLEDLASHGYIVAAVEHAHVSAPVVFPDGRLVPADFSLGGPRLADDDQVDITSREMRVMELCAADLQFVLDEMTKLSKDRRSLFYSKADVARVAAFGHSIGGRVAVRACQRDDRFRSCLNEDGPVNWAPFVPDDTGKLLAQPFMMIGHKDPPLPDAAFQQMHTTREQWDQMRATKIEAAYRTIYRSVLGGSYEVTLNVPEAKHTSFSDLALLRATTARQAEHQIQVMQLDRDYTRRFFDLTLRKDRSAALADADGEVTVRMFKPTVTTSSQR